MKASVDLGADPALSLSAGRAFLVARDTGTIFELDKDCGAGMGRFSANDGTPSNPQDLVVAPDGSLFVTRFGVPSILVIAKDGTRQTIDLSALDAVDGNPEMSGTAGIGSHAFVALGVLDRSTNFRSTRPSVMAVVDMTTHMLERTVTLAGRNPFGSLFVEGNVVWLAEPGNFDALENTAGLERFDSSTMTSKLAVPETSLGANVTEVVVSGDCAVAILADTSTKNKTSLVAIDIPKRRVIASLLGTPEFTLRGLVLSDSWLVVGDRTKSDAGYALHAFKRTGCAFQADHDVFVPAPPIALRFSSPR